MKPGVVRPLAVCVFRHQKRIFVAEGHDAIKQQTFYRPLGGRIEFGEYGHQTITRELMEEIGQPVTDVRYLGTLQNVFTYNGDPGHEIVLIYEGAFADPAMYDIDEVEGRDDGELLFVAKWKKLKFFKQGRAPLYPDGLLDMLVEMDKHGR